MQTQTDIENRIANILGQRVVLVKPVHRGYTPALRWLVTLADGRRCFAKIATTEMTAAWLPSIAYDGGPLPETFLPDAGVLTVILAGYFASRAGLPIIPHAPRVREVQLAQLKTALPWMCRALKLPPAF